LLVNLWVLWIDHNKFCGSHEDAIQNEMHGPYSLAHWTNRGKIGEVDSTEVDWAATGWTTKAASITRPAGFPNTLPALVAPT
jgi:hypothetical protein